MDRYVVVDADGYAVNVVLWDGETPFDADGGGVLSRRCKATETRRFLMNGKSASPDSPSVFAP